MLGPVREPLLATGPEPASRRPSPVRHTPVTLLPGIFPTCCSTPQFPKDTDAPPAQPSRQSASPQGAPTACQAPFLALGYTLGPCPDGLLLGWHSSTHKLDPALPSLLQPWLPPAHEAAPTVYCEDAAQTAPHRLLLSQHGAGFCAEVGRASFWPADIRTPLGLGSPSHKIPLGASLVCTSHFVALYKVQSSRQPGGTHPLQPLFLSFLSLFSPETPTPRPFRSPYIHVGEDVCYTCASSQKYPVVSPSHR